ncbi:MAG: DUF1232 domain-containing protein [Ruminococcaceae bacterium]|nr:DUF1232 domain-containing protein [Oscillospiraceae bacterium]
MSTQETNVINENEFVTEEDALIQLKKGYENAETILKDEDKLEELFQRLEEKLKEIPAVGTSLAHVATIGSMVKSYVSKEYDKIPIGTIVAAISALVYVISPIDLIPDFIPFAGLIDDAMVITACLKLIDSDITEYIKWRKENGKELFPSDEELIQED